MVRPTAPEHETRPGRASGRFRARGLVLSGLVGALAAVPGAARAEEATVVRVSLAGYRPDAPKGAVVLSSGPLAGTWAVLDATGRRVLEAPLPKEEPKGWGAFPHAARLDVSALRGPGRYRVVLSPSGASSPVFRVDDGVLREAPDVLLEFLRQQRCGWNPYLGAACHTFDGATAYGPLSSGTWLDARGGWHDAGDQLKYLLTSSTATAHLLQAYLVNPGVFGDAFDALGRPGANGMPDVLDEARWGLDWMLRLHPDPCSLYHQVADDRDHRGWRLPPDDDADYGWGPGRERTVYFADGKPQGLGRYASASTGVANLAGRYAAAMALAHRVWKDDPRLGGFAEECLRAGTEVYALGRAQEGVQQGNSYGAPYRYAEESWADDMEWGAAELFRETGEARYLEDGARYARLAGAASWMGRTAVGHYQHYPFVNLGHFALHAVAPEGLRGELAAYAREGLEKAVEGARAGPFRPGVPFVWCSNNLVAALVVQGFVHERMTGDGRYGRFLADQLGWLLGENPWGVSMVTGWPDGGPFPTQPHLPTTDLSGRAVRGGLVDGPVKEEIFLGLKGVRLTRADAFASFQSEEAVWHDDVMDYATNEPTMDGSAEAVLAFALATAPRPLSGACAVREGGLVRGPVDARRIALVFTGHEFAEGATAILDALAARKAAASLFVTGAFCRDPENRPVLARALAEGHLVGPHSDAHLLYAPWSGEKRTLVSRAEFRNDLARNLEELRKLGVEPGAVSAWVPPFEWWTPEIAGWSREMGLRLVGVTPGTRAAADYTGEGSAEFVSSEAIAESVLARERLDPHGLNGWVLLMHLGAGPGRRDKLFERLPSLLDALAARGYTFVRLDALARECSPG
ncbi:MAG: glycoside hydrolase family 9 protein [Thermoanaerobaculia bacterium]